MDFHLCPVIKKKDFWVPSHVYYSHIYAVIALLSKKNLLQVVEEEFLLGTYCTIFVANFLEACS